MILTWRDERGVDWVPVILVELEACIDITIIMSKC